MEVEGGGKGGICNAFAALCVGIVLLPAGLLLLAYNENNFKCEQNRILFADETAQSIGCSEADTLKPDGMYFFSCPIVRSSLQTFTPRDFAPVSGNVAEPAMTAVSARMDAEMLLCTERCGEKDMKNAAGQNVRVKKCSYSLQWTSEYSDGSSFHGDVGGACGGPGFHGNPPAPSEDLLSSPIKYSQVPIKVGDQTNGYKLNGPLIQRLTPNKKVDLSDPAIRNAYTGSRVTSRTPNAPFSFSTETLKVRGDYLMSCDAEVLGCIRIQFWVSDATQPSVITRIGSQGATSPKMMPGAWGCPAGQPWQAIDGDTMTKPEFIYSLQAQIGATLRIMRMIGLGCCWLAVFLCFSPCLYAVDTVGDVMNWLPCGGYIEDMLEGLATGVACAISCTVGCSCGFFVIAIFWLVMRPLYGGVLMAVPLGCLASGVYAHKTLHTSKERALELQESQYGSTA